VIPNTYMFFKVVTKDMLAPGKINFAFGDGQYVRARRDSNVGANEASSPTKRIVRSKVELSAYFSVSDKNREPTKENCDKAVESPSGPIAMPALGKDRFENEAVYMSLYSITGCLVILTASFPDLKIQNYQRKLVKEDKAEEADFENFLVCKKWKAQNKNRGTDKDFFIREHVSKVANYASWQMRRNNDLIEMREIRSKDVALRK